MCTLRRRRKEGGLTMGFTTSCFIRKNTPELRKRLEKLGYMSMFSNANGICLATAAYIENYFSISEGLFNDKHPYRTYDYAGRIDCGTNEELFLAIAALRDDTDKYQWFIPPAGAWVYNKGYESILEVSLKWRKATVNELIEHFKEKEEI